MLLKFKNWNQPFVGTSSWIHKVRFQHCGIFYEFLIIDISRYRKVINRYFNGVTKFSWELNCRTFCFPSSFFHSLRIIYLSNLLETFYNWENFTKLCITFLFYPMFKTDVKKFHTFKLLKGYKTETLCRKHKKINCYNIINKNSIFLI